MRPPQLTDTDLDHVIAKAKKTGKTVPAYIADAPLSLRQIEGLSDIIPQLDEQSRTLEGTYVVVKDKGKFYPLREYVHMPSSTSYDGNHRRGVLRVQELLKKDRE